MELCPVSEHRCRVLSALTHRVEGLFLGLLRPPTPQLVVHEHVSAPHLPEALEGLEVVRGHTWTPVKYHDRQSRRSTSCRLADAIPDGVSPHAQAAFLPHLEPLLHRLSSPPRHRNAIDTSCSKHPRWTDEGCWLRQKAGHSSRISQDQKTQQ
eukprot:753868-Hanusia_phi.AAC.4